MKQPDLREFMLQRLAQEKNITQAVFLDRIEREFPRAAGLLQTQDLPPETTAEIMAIWSDFFRQGIISWGWQAQDDRCGHFHLTKKGRQTLTNLARDPRNEAAYLQFIESRTVLSEIARSYLVEAVRCFNSGHFKAAAVMLGGATETLVIELRDAVAGKLQQLGQPDKKLSDWKAKTVIDLLQVHLNKRFGASERELKERFDCYWAACLHHIRTARNEAGHPSSVTPVTEDTVHAGLLYYPALSLLIKELRKWIDTWQ